jgi:hypothetical protein
MPDRVFDAKYIIIPTSEAYNEISKSLDIKHDLAEFMRAKYCDVGRAE